MYRCVVTGGKLSNYLEEALLGRIETCAGEEQNVTRKLQDMLDELDEGCDEKTVENSRGSKGSFIPFRWEVFGKAYLSE